MIPSTDRQTWNGLFYLRAAFCVAIVAWHCSVLGTSSVFNPAAFPSHIVEASDVIYLYFCLLGSPMFFLISFFLAAGRRGEKGLAIARIGWLFWLCMFWLTLWTLCRGGFGALGLRYHPSAVWPDIHSLLWHVVTGGSGPYYYFFSLLGLTCVCFAAVRLPRGLVWSLLAASVAAVGLVPLAVARWQSWAWMDAYWMPLNFVPYVFIGILSRDYIDRHPRSSSSPRFTIALLPIFLLFVGLAISEWWYLPHGNNFAHNITAIPMYTRLSVVVGTTAFFFLSFLVTDPPPPWIRFVSDNSLGIYCIHVLLLWFCHIDLLAIGPLRRIPAGAFAFLAVLPLSLLGTVLLRRALGKRLV